VTAARTLGRVLLVAFAMTGPADAESSLRLEPAAFAELAGWDEDDHGAALQAFRRGCGPLLAAQPPLRPALAPIEPLLGACRAALDREPRGGSAKAFFERYFEPRRVVPPAGDGFLTGYYEPEFEGALAPSPDFPVPLLARPDDLVSVPQGGTLPGLGAGLQAARRTAEAYGPYPDRAAIEDGALGSLARPLIHLREPGEAFLVHVQGSARIRLEDGRVLRLAYAGRNGHRYTSIGRLLIEAGAIPADEMSLERLLGWLQGNPGQARAVMRRNRSYIFFRIADELEPGDGPIGGAGVPLTPGRSLAVDRALWSYGLPFWLDGALPRPDGGTERLDRLTIAQDTGSAIVGPARGDLFMGSGPEAGTRAGLLRHPAGFTVLWPKARP
jgi:membrane-bound lytic murein transglycosylase A